MRARFTIVASLLFVLAIDACSEASPTEAAKAPVPTMTAVSDIAQQGTVNQFVASTPAVRVADASGRPVAGVDVVFSANGESFPTITTGPDGLASTPWRLAQTAGSQTMVARLYSAKLTLLGPATTFTALALADTLAAIRAFSLVAQVGFASHGAPTPPTVLVVDEYSNPKPGVEVTFEVTGGGTVTPANVTTDSTGHATVGVWTLGSEFATDTLIAQVENLPPVYFTARVSPPFVVTSLVSGYQHTCAIANGDVYCWGVNTRGQAAPGDLSALWIVPHLVPLGVKAVSLSSGYNHTCAISNEVPPQAYCWGDNSFGQLGVATVGPGPVRVAVADGLAVVTTGSDHSCGLTPAGVAYCWGNGALGQLGNGGTLSCYVLDNGLAGACPGPSVVSGDLRFVSIAAGNQHTCGLVANGQMYCWGLDDGGQLGFGSASPCSAFDYYDDPYPVACALTPQVVSGVPSFAAVGAGGDTCALAKDGSVACFGPPSGTELVPKARSITSLASDGACGLGVDGLAFCWIPGFDVPLASFAQPQPIASGTAFSAITPAQRHRCGILKDNNAAVCWGANDAGQLGTGTASGSVVPLPVTSPVPPNQAARERRVGGPKSRIDARTRRTTGEAT